MKCLSSFLSRTSTGTKRWFGVCSALTVSILLSACASIGTAAPPEDQVKQRATERWQALVAGDFDKAYSYSTPGFRALVTPYAYRDRIGSAARWLSAEAASVACSEVVVSKCDVKIKLDYQPVLSHSGPYTTYLDESWLLEDGQWWIFLPIGK